MGQETPVPSVVATLPQSSVTRGAPPYRPGRATPEVWATWLSDAGSSLAFFRFDTDDELVPGLWTFEVWDGEVRLYHAEFEIVPAAALPEITEACGAVS